MTTRSTSRILAVLVGAGVLVAPVRPAFAQTAPVAPAPSRPAPADDVLKRRYHINLMEGVLVRAVRHGADVLGSRLRPFNPNMVLLTGTARARGFLLDGYGVFFDVEIPAMRESVAWSIRTLTLEPDPLMRQVVADMRRQIEALNDAGARSRLQQAIAQLERQIGRTGPGASVDPGARRVSSATADQESAGTPEAQRAEQAAPALRDPNELYTDTVKSALIEAMLDHGSPMGIGADEWLTVAAKDAEGPLSPSEPYEAVTIVLRIRGSDLAAFRADRITREEAMKRVEVREF